MLAQIFEFRHGHADIFGTGGIVKNSNQSLRLRKWQRLEKDRLNEREDGDVATNSDRQSQHANEKKSRRLYECSRGIAQIGDKIFHSASSTNVADVFMPNRKFHNFIIITMILLFTHDSARSLSSGPVIAASNSGRCPRSGRLPCGLLVGCVDLYKVCLRREVDHHRAKRRPDQRVLIEGSAKGCAELIQTLGTRHNEAKM